MMQADTGKLRSRRFIMLMIQNYTGFLGPSFPLAAYKAQIIKEEHSGNLRPSVREASNALGSKTQRNLGCRPVVSNSFRSFRP